MADRPRYFVVWRHNGENHWEAVSDKKFANLVNKILQQGVNPASIFISAGAMCNWLFPEYHKGCRNLWINKLYDEINGTSKPSDYSGPDVPAETKVKNESLYGFISPDGRHFQCCYGGHSELARKIVGEFHKVSDAQRFLEDHGWLAIYHDPFNTGKYAAGMGFGKRITDEQIKTMQRIGLPTNMRGMKEILGVEPDGS